MPLITIVLPHFFTDEKLTGFKILGLFIGFLGVSVLFMPDEFGLGLTGDWIALLIVPSAAFCYVATIVVANMHRLASGLMGAACIAGVIAAVIAAPGGQIPNVTALTMILLLGFGSTGEAIILYLIFIDRVGPSAMARLNYFPPVVSMIFSVWFLSEPFT